MKWYHLPILISMALTLYAIEQRLTLGGASAFIVLGSIPGLIYVSSKSLEMFIGRHL